MYKNVIKRLIDFILSSIAIIVLALPMLIISIVIKIDDPGPVLFKQKRVGKKKNGEIPLHIFLIIRNSILPVSVALSARPVLMNFLSFIKCLHRNCL